MRRIGIIALALLLGLAGCDTNSGLAGGPPGSAGGPPGAPPSGMHTSAGGTGNGGMGGGGGGY